MAMFDEVPGEADAAHRRVTQGLSASREVAAIRLARSQDSVTWSSRWIAASTPVGVTFHFLLFVATGWLYPQTLFGAWLVLSAACVCLAELDRRMLRSRGFDQVASAMWAALLPGAYLALRARLVGSRDAAAGRLVIWWTVASLGVGCFAAFWIFIAVVARTAES